MICFSLNKGVGMSAGQDSSLRAILYAFLANFGIALAKTWGAVITGSGSMLAEAIHSYADSTNQVLLFIGIKQSQKPADEDHPLGYGKLSYFWSFIVALMLFSLGGLFSIYEGLHKLQSPEPLNQVWIAVGILVLAIILEGGSLFGALREIGKLRGASSFSYWLRHTRNAELVVVFGEDVAALLGLCLALAALLMTAYTGNPVYDALGSIAIGIVLMCVSVFIAIRIRSLIIGKSAEPELQKLINDIVAADTAIEEVLNTITVQLGPQMMLAAKIRMQSDLTIGEAVDHINDLERELKAKVPMLKWCFIEPDNKV
jgi:cation diffusion facilitator family transporter